MVFQNYALYPHMSVNENLAFPLEARRSARPERDERVRGGREHARARASCSTRSPGSSRAASASVWRWGARSCASRKLFLMDEPLSNLDAKLRVEMRAEIARSSGDSVSRPLRHPRPGRSDDARRSGRASCTTASSSRSGRPARCTSDRQNLFVATFLGNPGTHVFDGTVSANGDG